MRITVAVPVAVTAAVAMSAADLVLFAAAAVALAADGPSLPGYRLLEAANHGAVPVAIVWSLVCVLRALGGTAGRRAPLTLVVAAVLTACVAGGLQQLGRVLSEVEPLHQPLDLNSLLLALEGTGTDLLAVPVVLGVAALVVGAIRIAGRHGLRRPVVASHR